MSSHRRGRTVVLAAFAVLMLSCGGRLFAQDYYVAVGASTCSGGPCTAIYRYTGGTATLIHSQSPAAGLIEAIAVDSAGNWFAAVDDLAGGTAVLRNGTSIGALPGIPVDIQVGPDDTAYVAVQVTVPTVLAGEVWRWDDPGFTQVFTQPAPVEPLVAMDLDRDGAIYTVTLGAAAPTNRFYKDGTFFSSYGSTLFQDLDVGVDSYLYFSVASIDPTFLGDVIQNWPTSISTLYQQPAAMGPIDDILVEASLGVISVSDGHDAGDPAELVDDGVVIHTFTGFDMALDVKAPAIYYPAPWVDVGGGAPGLLGVPQLQAEGVLAVGSPGSVILTSAPGFALVMLYVSTFSTPTPFKGGTLYPAPPQLAILQKVTWDGFKETSWFSWPPGLAPGTDLWFQYAVQDSSASGGLSVSNALRGTQP